MRIGDMPLAAAPEDRSPRPSPGCLASYMGLPVGKTVGAVKAGLPTLLDPRLLPWSEASKLVVPAIAIAIAAFAESAGVAKRFADEAGESLWRGRSVPASRSRHHVIIACVPSMMIISSAGDKWDPNRELVSSGIANIFVGFFGGFAVGVLSILQPSVHRLTALSARLEA